METVFVARPNGFGGAALAGVNSGGATMASPDIAQLTDQILWQIDRRFRAARERMGKM